MNKVIFNRLVQSIAFTIIITLLYSINHNLAISFIGGIIIGVAFFITDYLYSFNKKYLNILLVIIAGVSYSISLQVVCKDLSLSRIICNFVVILVAYKTARHNEKVNNKKSCSFFILYVAPDCSGASLFYTPIDKASFL